MDHSAMEHHGHMGHGDGDMGDMPMCNMNMLFTWNTENLCIVFSSWRITGTWTLLASLVAIILLTSAYEALRNATRLYDQKSQEYLNSLPTDDNEQRSWRWLGQSSEQAKTRTKVIKAALYALQIFYSFFIMLLFMTYNGWIMIAVAIGAFLGYLGFNSDTPAAKDVSCH